MKVYVTSRSGHSHFALEEGNVVAVCYSGPDPYGDAKSYAIDHTKAIDEPTWIYEVEIKALGSMRTKKEVVFHPADARQGVLFDRPQ